MDLTMQARDRLTWRRLLVLVSGLPADSAWRWWRTHRPLEGAEADAYIARLGV